MWGQLSVYRQFNNGGVLLNVDHTSFLARVSFAIDFECKKNVHVQSFLITDSRVCGRCCLAKAWSAQRIF